MRQQVLRRQVDFTLILGTALLCAILPGCGRPGPAPLIQGRAEQPCTVFFRRDALGMASDLPSSPRETEINGAQTTLTGTFVRSTPDELVLLVDGKVTIIPREVILMTQLTPSK